MLLVVRWKRSVSNNLHEKYDKEKAELVATIANLINLCTDAEASKNSFFITGTVGDVNLDLINAVNQSVRQSI